MERGDDSLRKIGSCPRCGARIELGVGQPPATGSCAACGQRHLVVVPEEGEDGRASGAERVLELLALREPPRAPSLREARGLRRTQFRSILGLTLLPLLLAVFAFAFVAVPEAGPLERVGFFVFAILAVLLVVFPFAGLLALLLVHLFLARRPAAPARGHSVQVVALAGLGLGASFLLSQVGERVPLGGVLAVIGLLAAIFLGWSTSRLAPAEPYRHAFVASALYLALGTLMALPLGLKMMVVVPLGLAFLVPLFLLGAWLGVRFAPRVPGTPLTP